jgi:hypothetical protein
MELSLIVGAAILAGIIQGVTGFGSGIVLMMVLPMMFTLPQSAGISSAICICLCVQMVYMYRKYVDFKKIILPALLYIVVCSISIRFSTVVDQAIMKKVFGVFLLVLAIYYLFIYKEGTRKKLGLGLSLFCIVASAMCDGLFGIGGPLMVLYFLSTTHTTHEYLGTIQTFFCINCIYNTIFRIANGILTVNHLLYIGIGIIGIIIGGFIGNKIVDKLDGMMLKKLTYIMIGISGIMNLI